MHADEKLKVVLCWHMHQPEYRDAQGEFQLPWTYLHAIKDYVDMAAHLEAHPKARAVVNFAPILIEQIQDYAQQIETWFDSGQPIRDPLLSALAGPVMPRSPERRLFLAKACLKVNQQHMVDPHPVFSHLLDTVRWMDQYAHAIDYVSDQFLADLLMWYHLVWMGSSVYRSDVRIKKFIGKQVHFTVQDRRSLVELIGELTGGILDRYKSLACQGRIELSMTPYGHPIMPLLIDLESAREALPEVKLPSLTTKYPGGVERVEWHLRHGLGVFNRTFGMKPNGCWPSEGSISDATLELLNKYGFKWVASGETVLANSLQKMGTSINGDKSWLYRPYQFRDTNLYGFFRDDNFSDAIGFKYSNWHGDDAAADFVQGLERLTKAAPSARPRIVSVILDGENAWEYYPANGYYFLSRLYELLSEHPDIEMTTFNEALETLNDSPPRLDHIVAGSWVYGTFSTWIGNPDKDRGWEMLIAAKGTFDCVIEQGLLKEEEIEAAKVQLGICEGSDWCWWFGDYNPSVAVNDFDRLYRLHLANLYSMLHESPPEHLSHAFSFGGGEPQTGGTMRRGQD